MNPFGYAGKILEVDLSTGASSEISTEAYAQDYLGGRGLATRLYYERVSPRANAYSAENCLIFATGLLTGFPRLSGSRCIVCGKSPSVETHLFSYANLGGSWGTYLKFAGYDAIVVKGKAEKPVYLFIEQGKVLVKDASHLWGKSCSLVRRILKAELGKYVRVLTIGQAGENLVSFATLSGEDGASGSGGLGAVMGSKRIKAIAVAGNLRPISAEPERLHRLADCLFGLRGKHFDYTTKWEHKGKTKRRACFGCVSKCARQFYWLSENRPVKFFCQMADVYEAAAIAYHGRWDESIVRASDLCQEYGVNTFVLEPMIYWLHRCYQEGIISEQDSGLLLTKIGSWEFFEQLLRKITFREGIGDVLALGTLQASQELGKCATELIGDLVITRSNELNVYDPRLFITPALLYATETRMPIAALHEVSMTLHEWEGLKGIGIRQDAEGTFLSYEDLFEIAEIFWGSASAVDFSTWEGKALAAKKIQDRTCLKDSIGLCDFMWPVLFVKHKDRRIGDPSLESQLVSAVTGTEVDREKLESIGEKVFDLQRVILIREGWRGKYDDILPEVFFKVPLGSPRFNPECVVPGPNGKILSRKGAILEKQQFEKAREQYYNLRKWDIQTGFPKPEKLSGSSF